MNIEKIIRNYKTKYREGFMQSEITGLLKKIPNIDRRRFDNALDRISCPLINDEIIIYRHDIERALYCGIEKRNLRTYEWD